MEKIHSIALPLSFIAYSGKLFAVWHASCWIGINLCKLGELMRKTNKLALAAALLICGILGTGTIGNAAGAGQQGYQGSLSQEQLEQARKILSENYASMESTRDALSAKRNELERELAKTNPDRTRIESLSQEIGNLRGKLLGARIDARNRLVEQGLSPDCFGPCAGGMPMMGGYGYRGDYDGYHHGGGHHRGGRRGCW